MEEVKKVFEEQTGLQAVVISQIGIGVYMVEASDGNTYVLRQGG